MAEMRICDVCGKPFAAQEGIKIIIQKHPKYSALPQMTQKDADMCGPCSPWDDRLELKVPARSPQKAILTAMKQEPVEDDVPKGEAGRSDFLKEAERFCERKCDGSCEECIIRVIRDRQ